MTGRLPAPDAVTPEAAPDREGRPDELGIPLTAARTSRGWTQRQLAVRLEIPARQLERYEASRYVTANLATLVKVARALGLFVSAQCQLFDAPPETPEARRRARRATARLFQEDTPRFGHRRRTA